MLCCDQATLKKKEELAQGLPLIDFEQLKIENQTLNERIEDRNEELLKLRKKTTATVQVLTHIKEKLQFVQQEVSVQKEKLEGLDGEVSHHRDLLTHLKHERDRLRAENMKLKQQGGMMDDALLEDFEGREVPPTSTQLPSARFVMYVHVLTGGLCVSCAQEATEQLTERLAYLKAKHAEYTNVILAANQASANVAQGLA
eukprot:COSAG04_NODE_1113_length_8218_cov_2.688262_6_plen_200_part_00